MFINPFLSIQNVLPTIINVLTPLLDIGDETVQLKVLQTMLTLITSSNNLHGNALAQALGLCFRLHDSRSPSVHHTASATLRQVVTMLFDRTGTEMESVAKADREAATTVEAKAARPLLPYATDAYLFLQDLCTLTGGDPPAWLSIDHVSKALGLELIESILGSHHRLFLEVRELLILLPSPSLLPLFPFSSSLPSFFALTLSSLLPVYSIPPAPQTFFPLPLRFLYFFFSYILPTLKKDPRVQCLVEGSSLSSCD
jgi:hypothetical protein